MATYAQTVVQPAAPHPNPPALRARRRGLDELSEADVERWRALAAIAVEPNPFFEPEFVLAAAEHLGERGLSLLVVEDDSTWRACLPVQRTRIARLLAGLRVWSHLYCFLGTPLMSPHDTGASARALLELALAVEDRLVLEDLGDDGPVAGAVRRAMHELGLVTVSETAHQRALLERRPNDDYLDGLRGHRRRELNRLGRRLEAELGAALSICDRSRDAAALDRFIELERSGWKGHAQTAVGSSPGHARFFRDVCESFAAAGRLELLALSAGDRTVAMKCNLYSGEGGFCFKIAYDEQLARYSPGVQLERENVHVFHDHRGERWQDSCADPENTMINSLWPDRRPIRTSVLARRGAGAALSRHSLRLARAIRDTERTKSSTRS